MIAGGTGGTGGTGLSGLTGLTGFGDVSHFQTLMKQHQC